MTILDALKEVSTLEELASGTIYTPWARYETGKPAHFGKVVREEMQVGDQGVLWEGCHGRDAGWRPRLTLGRLSGRRCRLETKEHLERLSGKRQKGKFKTKDHL